MQPLSSIELQEASAGGHEFRNAFADDALTRHTRSHEQVEVSVDDSLNLQREAFRPPPRMSTMDLEERKQLIVACPFFKKDSIKYRACAAKMLCRISDVKQHLIRKHTPEHYCQACGEAFGDEYFLDKHVTLSTCTRGAFSLDGVTYRQRRQLSRKSNCMLSKVDQWYSIWDILFPDLRRPSNIWVDHRLGMDCNIMIDKILLLGPKVLADSLDGHITWILRDPDDQFRIVSGALNTMLDKTLKDLGEVLDFSHANEPGRGEKVEADLGKPNEWELMQRWNVLPTDSGFVEEESNASIANTTIQMMKDKSPPINADFLDSTNPLRAVKQLEELVGSRDCLQRSIDELMKNESHLEAVYNRLQGLEEADSNAGSDVESSCQIGTEDSEEESLTASQFSELDDTGVDWSHRFFSVEAIAVREFTDKYCAKEHTLGGTDKQGSSTKCTSAQEGSGEKAKNPTKRQRSNDDAESEDERSLKHSVKRGRKRLAEGSHRLACPFYKKEPKGYASCFRHHFLEINRMKQHLKLVHKRGPFCLRCREDFPSNEELTTHVNHHMENNPCQKRIVDSSIALSDEKIRLLKNKVDKTLTLFDQWYQVWDVIFPEDGRPPTCTIDPELSAALLDLQDFSEKQGPRIILDVLDRHNLRVATRLHDMDQDEAALSAFTDQVLAKANKEIFDIWQAQRDTSVSNLGDKESIGAFPLNQSVPRMSGQLSPGYFTNKTGTPTGLAAGDMHPDIEPVQSNGYALDIPPQIEVGDGQTDGDLLISSPQGYLNDVPEAAQLFSRDISELRDDAPEAFDQTRGADIEGWNFSHFIEGSDSFYQAL
jgi:hypothetical protein